MSELIAKADVVERIEVSGDAVVYPEGWQSWTPTDFYPITGSQHCPVDQRQFALGYRVDRPAPSGRPGEFVADGLLALVDPAAGSVHVLSAVDPARPARLTAVCRDGVCTVRADDEINRVTVPLQGHGERGHDGLGRSALTEWVADSGWAPPEPTVGTPSPTPALRAPSVWCSWYQYFTDLTQADVLENLHAMEQMRLGFEVVQVDDGYQRQIGDWLDPSPRFPDLPGLIADIRDAGRRAGIWIAPWLVGEQSRLAAEHPDWLVHDEQGQLISAGFNWGQTLRVLDTTHDQAWAYLREVMQSFVDAGVDYFKLDFLYAGALPGVRADGSLAVQAYRSFLSRVRENFPHVYVVGCGAPIVPSVGLVHAMRVSPDTAPHVQPSGGDFSAPGQLSAMITGRARRWQHGAWWTNDPDCLLARPEVEARGEWARYLVESPGLRGCSDRLRSLDSEGISYTIRHLGCATIQA